MDFISKSTFYVMFGISLLMVLFFFGSTIYGIQKANTKPVETIILAIAGILICTGSYLSYQVMNSGDNYVYGCGILGLTWLATILMVIIGFLVFVPVHWQ
ncbi:MAG: hypothetical protein IPL63_17070 [Saprospiraceae bacterium]|nr:hypothetical protein [Saprospiraceae bacterium]MBK8548990.1 hypothetical protein [Saprospiraceae bacterium]